MFLGCFFICEIGLRADGRILGFPALCQRQTWAEIYSCPHNGQPQSYIVPFCGLGLSGDLTSCPKPLSGAGTIFFTVKAAGIRVVSQCTVLLKQKQLVFSSQKAITKTLKQSINKQKHFREGGKAVSYLQLFTYRSEKCSPARMRWQRTYPSGGETL